MLAASTLHTATADSPYLRILTLGDAALTVEFGERIDAHTHQRVMGYCHVLEGAKKEGTLAGVIEWVPSFCAVTVYFDPLCWRSAALSARLRQLVAQIEDKTIQGCRWRIPIAFGGDFGPDLSEVATHCHLSCEAVIALMTHTVFRVYLLGFMPGFPYMGGLPEVLAMPRLTVPRTEVPAKSLAIAGNMCAIYPWQSPGGWRLLGRSPLTIFSAGHIERPALFAPGDEVVWQPIDHRTYAELAAASDADQLPREAFLVSRDAPWPL